MGTQITYVPSIFTEEIWEYFMSTVGTFVGTKKVWDSFCKIIEYYNGDIKRLSVDFENITTDLINLFTKGLDTLKLNEEDYNLLKNPYRFNNLSDGVYLTIDLKKAHLQALLYFNAITVEDIQSITDKYEYGKLLLNEKIIYGNAYRLTPYCARGFIFDRNLINTALSCDDPLINLINENCEKIAIIGDRLFLKIINNESLFEPYLYKDYVTSNNIHFFVDICEKITLHSMNFPDIYVDNSKVSNKKFYANLYGNTINYDLYPQIYKKIIRENIEQQDLAYGYDDNINYFIKKIWEE